MDRTEARDSAIWLLDAKRALELLSLRRLSKRSMTQKEVEHATDAPYPEDARRALVALEERGLVSRSRDDRAVRQRSVWQPTKAGREVLARVDRALEALDDPLPADVVLLLEQFRHAASQVGPEMGLGQRAAEGLTAMPTVHNDDDKRAEGPQIRRLQDLPIDAMEERR